MKTYIETQKKASNSGEMQDYLAHSIGVSDDLQTVVLTIRSESFDGAKRILEFYIDGEGLDGGTKTFSVDELNREQNTITLKGSLSDILDCLQVSEIISQRTTEQIKAEAQLNVDRLVPAPH